MDCRSTRGSALLLLMTLALLLLLIGISASVSSVSDIGLTAEEKIKSRLELACESALNRARAKIELSFNNGSLNVLEPEITFQGEDIDATGLAPDEKAFEDEEYYFGDSGDEPDYYKYLVESDESHPIYVKYFITEEEEWEKSAQYTQSKHYVEAIAYTPGIGWSGVGESVTVRRSTLFMYNIFFENDLEILPGPNFNLTGLIHTNENMYLSTGNTVNITSDSVTAAGEIFRKRLDTGESTGTVKITETNKNGSLVTMGNGQDSSSTSWVNTATSRWKGTVRDKDLGVSKLQAPKLESFEPGGFYDNHAGLRIKVLASGRPTPEYEITYNGSQALSNADLGNALTEVTFYDRRESTTTPVKATQINLESLQESDYWPENGLIYMSRDDAVPDSNPNDYTADSNRVVRGFKLTNGEMIPDATTFVSDLPTYIKGNFNIHTSADPAVDTWQPCAVVSDAITLLSNNWQDSQSSSKRDASNTSYNLVFITGNTKTKPNVSSQDNNYNGGLENFPRLLENWSGKTLTIKGGFMQLFRSQYATGRWKYGTYYDAPTRNWSAEGRFSNLSDFPPLFTDLFPSTNFGIIFYDWEEISKDEASLVIDDDDEAGHGKGHHGKAYGLEEGHGFGNDEGNDNGNGNGKGNGNN